MRLKLARASIALGATLASLLFSTPTSWAGYAFTSHTFTPCGAIGKLGPTQANCRTAYTTTWDEADANFTVTSGIQLWVVPSTGNYRILAKGAKGGDGNAGVGGAGASMQGDFQLTKGDVIKILVGQSGVDWTSLSGGGGGGGGTLSPPIQTLHLLLQAVEAVAQRREAQELSPESVPLQLPAERIHEMELELEELLEVVEFLQPERGAAAVVVALQEMVPVCANRVPMPLTQVGFHSLTAGWVAPPKLVPITGGMVVSVAVALDHGVLRVAEVIQAAVLIGPMAAEAMKKAAAAAVHSTVVQIRSIRRLIIIQQVL
jgi:hypothetical protein